MSGGHNRIDTENADLDSATAIIGLIVGVLVIGVIGVGVIPAVLNQVVASNPALSSSGSTFNQTQQTLMVTVDSMSEIIKIVVIVTPMFMLATLLFRSVIFSRHEPEEVYVATGSYNPTGAPTRQTPPTVSTGNVEIHHGGTQTPQPVREEPAMVEEHHEPVHTRWENLELVSEEDT
jgi:hypothetical protein